MSFKVFLIPTEPAGGTPVDLPIDEILTLGRGPFLSIFDDHVSRHQAELLIRKTAILFTPVSPFLRSDNFYHTFPLDALFLPLTFSLCLFMFLDVFLPTCTFRPA